MAKTSHTYKILEAFGLVKPTDNLSDAVKSQFAELDKGFAALSAEERPLSTIEVSDNRDSLANYELREGINQGIRDKDRASSARFKGQLQDQRTGAKIQEQNNLKRNTLDLMAVPAAALDKQSDERSMNVDKVLGYGTNENAADRELQKRAMTQDLITKLALGAAIAFG